MDNGGHKPVIDISLLIEEVQKRPALWDQGNQHRHNREVLDVLWDQVAREFNGVSADEVRKKWKGLRDTFRKELRKYTNGLNEDLSEDEFPQWVFFRPLYSFLRGQMRMRVRRSDADKSAQPNGYQYVNVGGDWVRKDEDEDTVGDLLDRADLEPIVACDTADTLRELGARGLKRPAADDLLADDEDYHFFLSLLPHVRKLEPMRKLQVRARIQDMICREVYDPQPGGDQGGDAEVAPASPSSVQVVTQSSSELGEYIVCDVKPFEVHDCN